MLLFIILEALHRKILLAAGTRTGVVEFCVRDIRVCKATATRIASHKGFRMFGPGMKELA